MADRGVIGEAFVRLCECGCGNQTRLATVTYPPRRTVKGQPLRFLHGHNSRLQALQFDDHFVVGAEDECWIWAGRLNAKGYGRFGDRFAYQIAYERIHGPTAPGLVHDHLCRVPACVNPSHIEAVTVAVNARRGLKTKLTEADARFIKYSTERAVDLARRFGVSPCHVSNLRAGRIWKEI